MVKDREAWHAVVHGVTKSRTQLSDWTDPDTDYVLVSLQTGKTNMNQLWDVTYTTFKHWFPDEWRVVSNLIPKAWRHIGILIFFKKVFIIYLFLAALVFVVVWRFLTVVASLVTKHRLCSPGSIVVAAGLSCSLGLWNPPAPGIEPLSPALAGGFFTTEPLGKSSANNSYLQIWICTGLEIQYYI